MEFYGITKDSVVHILPPSTVKKLRLSCHSLTSTFTIDVDPNRTVEQLKKEIEIEEKITAHSFEYLENADSEPKPMLPETNQLGSFRMQEGNYTLYIRPPPSPSPPPPSFFLKVELYTCSRRVFVETRPEETLASFRRSVKLQSGVSIKTDVLILVGKEVLGETLSVWELGLVPGCTIHAVPYMAFNVELAGVKAFEPMNLHPLTRLSKVRKWLKRQQRRDGSVPIALHRYGFTLDGRGHLPESRTLWDINLVSGSTLYLRPSTISITIQVDNEPLAEATDMDVEMDDTIDDILERWELISGRDPLPRKAKIYYRDKNLKRSTTVRKEGIVGGEILSCISCPWVRASQRASTLL